MSKPECRMNDQYRMTKRQDRSNQNGFEELTAVTIGHPNLDIRHSGFDIRH
jgi:hypothetical protein